MYYLCSNKKKIKMNIYIKEYLTKKGLTQKDIAEKLGVTQQSISATISRPSFPTLERIAAALGVEPWQLLAPPSVVAEVEQARQAAATTGGSGCPLVGVVRVGSDTYTANNLAELRAIVARLELSTAKPTPTAAHPHP